MKIGFRYGKRISSYEYDQMGKKYKIHSTVIIEDENNVTFDDYDILIDVDNPKFSNFPAYVEHFKQNKPFYVDRFIEEFYCEEKAVKENYSDGSKENHLKLRSLMEIIKIEFKFDFFDKDQH